MNILPANLPDYNFPSHFVTLGGHRLHYLDEGSGAPVVMVHGNPNWVYYWRKLIPALSDRYRCLAIDHMGCGLSDKPDDAHYEYSLRQRIEDLSAWLDQLNVQDNIHFIAHDWGGMIACGFATRFPERVKKLVMLNTGAFPLPKTTRIPWQLKLARTPVLGALLLRGFNAFSRGAVKSCVTRRPMPPDVAAAYCAPYDSWAHRIAVHRFVQDIPLSPSDRGYDLVSQIAADLPKLAEKPLMVGWGERDFVFNDHFLQEWITRCPQAEVVKYPDCGHYVLEDAADELIPRIREFLDRAIDR